MILIKKALFTGVVAAASIVSAASPGAAQSNFFQGKTITILAAGTAGGGIDLAARTIARHLSRHVPGQPHVIAQVMPGAGGIRALDFLSSAAPQDGTHIVIVPPGPMLEPLIGARQTSYRIIDFPALGAISKETSMCAAWHASKFHTVDDARKMQMSVGGTGAGSSTDIYPVVMNEVLGTKFKVITGFLGSQEVSLAIERGEVDGRCGWGWTSIKTTKLDWARDKKLRFLMQFGLTKNAEHPDVPLAIDLAEKPEDKQILRLLFAPLMLNDPVFAAPRTPPERVAQLRAAFSAMVGDQTFRADVLQGQGSEPNATSGEEAQKLLEEVYRTPEPVVARLKKILNP